MFRYTNFVSAISNVTFMKRNVLNIFELRSGQTEVRHTQEGWDWCVNGSRFLKPVKRDSYSSFVDDVSIQRRPP